MKIILITRRNRSPLFKRRPDLLCRRWTLTTATMATTTMSRLQSFKLPKSNLFGKEKSIGSMQKTEILEKPLLHEILAVLQDINGRMEEQSLRLELVETTKLHSASTEGKQIDRFSSHYSQTPDSMNDYARSILKLSMSLHEDIDGNHDSVDSGRESPHNGEVAPGSPAPKPRDFDRYSLSVYTELDRLASRIDILDTGDLPQQPLSPSSSTNLSPHSDNVPLASSQSSLFSYQSDQSLDIAWCANGRIETRPRQPQDDRACLREGQPQDAVRTHHEEILDVFRSPTAQGLQEIPTRQNQTTSPQRSTYARKPSRHSNIRAASQTLPARPLSEVIQHPRATLAFHAYTTWKAELVEMLRSPWSMEAIGPRKIGRMIGIDSAMVVQHKFSFSFVIVRIRDFLGPLRGENVEIIM